MLVFYIDQLCSFQTTGKHAGISTKGECCFLVQHALIGAKGEINTPKQPARTTKQKQPVYNTPPSSTSEKKTKSVSNTEEDSKYEVCLDCDCDILESGEANEGQDAIFCEENCQGWIHRICAALTNPAFENLSESVPYLCSYCTFTKQSKEICNLIETVKLLTNKVAELEGAKGPLPDLQSGSVSPAPAVPNDLSKNVPRSQPIPHPKGN